MPVLKNWCIEKINKMGKEETRVVRGNVYNSYKFKDGTFITSSRINSVVKHKDEQKVEVYTQNSIYECHWSDCDVAEGSTLEQVLLETVTRPNYFELMRKCSDGRSRLPKSPELFGMEAVCRQIIEDATNYVENIYLLIDECEDETAGKQIRAAVGSGVEIVMMLGKYDLAKRLLALGASVRLDGHMLWYTFSEGEQKNGGRLEFSFMEFVCLDWEIPDDLYALIWQNAKVRGAVPLEKALCLQLRFDKEQSRKIAINSLNRLREQWEEAADELLLAWVKYYLECFRSTETEIWEELFSVFPNKKGHIFKEITRQYLRIYDERNFFVYSQEADIIAFPTFWRMCTRDMEELERKQLVIYTIHVMLTKESEKQSVSEIWGIGKNKPDRDWFICEMLEGEKDFGELQIEQRNECTQILFDYVDMDLEVWKLFLKSFFVPKEYMGAYIDILASKNEKSRHILPLFVLTKMRRENDA